MLYTLTPAPIRYSRSTHLLVAAALGNLIELLAACTSSDSNRPSFHVAKERYATCERNQSVTLNWHGCFQPQVSLPCSEGALLLQATATAAICIISHAPKSLKSQCMISKVRAPSGKLKMYVFNGIQLSTLDPSSGPAQQTSTAHKTPEIRGFTSRAGHHLEAC